jgi:DNA-binding LacI/PurR family transcriptional regulator
MSPRPETWPTTSSLAERLARFRARLAERGVTHVETSGTAFDYQTGYAAAIEMFGRPGRPDVVFCANDLLAMGAIDGLRGRSACRRPAMRSWLGSRTSRPPPGLPTT